MKTLQILLLSLISSSVFAQLDEEKLSDIEKNILAYRIKNYYSTNYRDLIPDKDYYLDLEIVNIPDTFNIGKGLWKFYKITNDNFKYSNGKNALINTFTHDSPEYYKLSTISLIATNEKNDLIYLGGNFFETSIANQYDLSSKNIQSYYPFLQVKLYHYKLQKIKFLRKNKTDFIFEGFSNSISKNIIIRVNRVNPDEINIEK